MANYTNGGLYLWNKTDQRFTTIEETAKSMQKINDSLADIANSIGVSVESFKRTSSETDDNGRIQRAIDTATTMMPNGAVVVIPKEYTITEIQITKPNVTLTGGGTLKNGKLVIGDPTIIQEEMNFMIDGIQFKYDTLQDNNYGIYLRNSRRGRIINCTFRNTDKSIFFDAIDQHQHCSRILISDNLFHYVNYCVYIDHRDTAINPFGVGDLHFINNQAIPAYKTHFYAKGLDGLVMTENTFFFPTYTEPNQTKEYNIYLDTANFVIIANNNLFESGFESIFLSRVQNPKVVGNHIAWPGQRVASSGIRLKNGDASGGNYNLSGIRNNDIMFPTLHGISVEDNCGFLQISNNNTRSAGYPNYYYGTEDLNSMAHYGISTASTTTDLHITDNVNQANANNLLGSNHYYDGNLEANYKIQRSNEQQGSTGDMVFSTTWNSNIGTVTFPKPFRDVPNVQLTLKILSTGGTVTPVVTPTTTGFTVSGQASGNITAQFYWIAKV